VLASCLGLAPGAALALAPSGLLEIHYINVQQGGSTLVIGPDGTTLLLDAGADGKGTERVVPYLMGIGLLPSDGLHYTLPGHLEADHVGGLDEVIGAGYDVRIRNWYNGSAFSSALVDDWRAACGSTTAGAPVPIPLGQILDLGDGATLTVVAVAGDVIGYGHVPGSENNEADLSVAVLVEYGDFDFIWASDLGGGDDDSACTGRMTGRTNVETPLAQALTTGTAFPLLSDAGVDVLHVNHHGSEASTNSDWMNLLRPEVALISVGAGQVAGSFQPRREVVEQVLLAGASCVTAAPALVLQTEEGDPPGSPTSFAGYCAGDIVIRTDGVTGYRIEATGTVSQGPDERATAGLPATFPFDEPPPNQPPVADPQVVLTAEDIPLAITLTGSDPDGDPLTFAIVTPPANGSLAGTPPDVTYAPDTGFTGSDSFTFQVSDGQAVSAPAAVAITVTPVVVVASHNFESGWNGGTGWGGAWAHSGDAWLISSASPHSGVHHARLRRSNGLMSRAVNLSGRVGVRLRLWAKVSSFEAGDSAAIQVSPDGVSYTTVRQFTAADSDGVYKFYDLDLSGFTMTSTFRIRFDANMSGVQDQLYVDDVEIVAQ
jgi:hypothetical protein